MSGLGQGSSGSRSDHGNRGVPRCDRAAGSGRVGLAAVIRARALAVPARRPRRIAGGSPGALLCGEHRDGRFGCLDGFAVWRANYTITESLFRRWGRLGSHVERVGKPGPCGCLPVLPARRTVWGKPCSRDVKQPGQRQQEIVRAGNALLIRGGSETIPAFAIRPSCPLCVPAVRIIDENLRRTSRTPGSEDELPERR